jgi:hypothetical protein
MNSAEIKLELIRKIDTLERKQLNELTGVINNMIHGQYDTNDWELLSSDEKNGILDAMADLRKNGGIDHSVVMAKVRNRIANA